MTELTSQVSIEFIRPFLVFKDSKGKRLCVVPEHIASVSEVSNGLKIESTNGTKWFVKVTLEDLIDKIEESNYLF